MNLTGKIRWTVSFGLGSGSVSGKVPRFGGRVVDLDKKKPCCNRRRLETYIGGVKTASWKLFQKSRLQIGSLSPKGRMNEKVEKTRFEKK